MQAGADLSSLNTNILDMLIGSELGTHIRKWLKVQNASPNLILGVKIFKRATGEVTFQKKVSRFGVINVKI